MSTTSYYASQGISNLNNPYATIAELVSQLGGYSNPTTSSYTPAEKIDVTDPTLYTIANYLNMMGADGYTYDYDTILNTLNNATNAAYDTTQTELAQADAAYNRSIADTQASAMDTIRSNYAQGIQSGISKGMQAANQLSSILGATQSSAETAQTNAEAKITAAKEQAATLAANASTAMDTSNSAYDTLLSNIRQLYNDQIQEKTSELEYNASLEESLANYLANAYTADTNYAINQNTQAAGIYNNNQSALASVIAQAISGEAQDNYSTAYQSAAEAQANATIQAAQIAAAAQEAVAALQYANYGSSSSSSSSSSSGTTSNAQYTAASTAAATKAAQIAAAKAAAAKSAAAATTAAKSSYAAGYGTTNSQQSSTSKTRISGLTM